MTTKSQFTTLPAGREPVLRVMPMPADANIHGDVFGGWIMSQVDIAGSIPRRAAPPDVSPPWRSMPSSSRNRFSSATC